MAAVALLATFIMLVTIATWSAVLGASPPGDHSHLYPNCNTSAGLPRQARYSVAILDTDPVRPKGNALISHANGTSDFAFNFATAWFPMPTSRGGGRPARAGPGGVSAAFAGATDGLVVRVVECNPDRHPCRGVRHPEWSNAGALTVNHATLPADGAPTVEHVGYERVTWAGHTAPPRANVSEWGAADPRIAYRPANGLYYLTWDNCTQNCYPHRTTLLSTTKDPFDPDGWTFHGPLLPGVYTGGASLLFRDGAAVPAAASTGASADTADADAAGPAPPVTPPHLAFVGNSNTADAILLATSADGLTWTEPVDKRTGSPVVFMAGRDGCWDEKGVAAGPQPERLSNGDYLYVYNIDTGFPFHPGSNMTYLGRCALGWAILDRTDPTVVVARSPDAMLVPSAEWETCAAVGKGYACQEPEVLFSTGMKPLGGDEFLVFYGAADTDVGVAKIKVNIAA